MRMKIGVAIAGLILALASWSSAQAEQSVNPGLLLDMSSVYADKTGAGSELAVEDGHIRPGGLMVHDMYLFQVKAPEESKDPWQYYKCSRRYREIRLFSLYPNRCGHL
ncbi:MAG: hypothetical protein JOY71_00440 [Acetobacteraceae bacterium]|nr:hypothetical protein [Acetobacteraceae bacterium]MBV8520601.1 hypothetical protein [Acetobacteraceae bacterium]